MTTIAFVACVKSKADRPMPAKDLYLSPWFKLARRYAEQRASRWFILSAKYGLVSPDEIVAPYEKTLLKMGSVERGTWANMVAGQLVEHGVSGALAIVLAGLAYRNPLQNDLARHFKSVEAPMRGLMLGQQLQWLNRRTSLADLQSTR